MPSADDPPEDFPEGYWARTSLGRAVKRALKGVRENSIEKETVQAVGLDVTGWKQIDVTNHGVDNTGSQSIVSDVQDLLADERVLVFPGGDYLVPNGERIEFYDSANSQLRASKNVALVGRGGATIVHEGSSSDATWLAARGASTTDPIENLLISNLEVDFSNSSCGRRIQVTASGHGIVDGVVFSGTHDSGVQDSGPLVLRARQSGGSNDGDSLTVRNCDLSDGGAWAGNQQDSPTGIYVSADSVAPVHIEDCAVAGWYDNGLYASNASGPVHVRGGTYKNNNAANFRLGSPGSSARDVHTIIDSLSADHSTTRPVWLTDGTGPVTVENCRIEVSDGDVSTLSNAYEVSGDIESATIRGGRVQADAPIRLTNPSATNSGVDNNGLVFDGVTYIRTVEGEAGNVSGEDPIEHVGRVNRPDTVFRNVSVRAAVGGGTDVRGFRTKVAGVTFEDCSVHTDDRPLWIDSSDPVLVVGGEFTGTNAIDDRGTDVRYRDVDPSDVDSFDFSSATRPRWDGVIGGGPIGGVDVGSVTGASEGDRARSNGTTGDADGLYILKSGGDWQAVHDPTTTITPS